MRHRCLNQDGLQIICLEAEKQRNDSYSTQKNGHRFHWYPPGSVLEHIPRCDNMIIRNCRKLKNRVFQRFRVFLTPLLTFMPLHQPKYFFLVDPMLRCDLRRYYYAPFGRVKWECAEERYECLCDA